MAQAENGVRDLTKAAARLSWAFFVYGAQHVASSGRRRGPGDGADDEPAASRERPTPEQDQQRRELSDGAEDLARRAQGRLESDFQSLYELGERTGERMIDFGFDVMDPRRFIDRAAGFVHRVSEIAEGREEERKEDDARAKAEA